MTKFKKILIIFSIIILCSCSVDSTTTQTINKDKSFNNEIVIMMSSDINDDINNYIDINSLSIRGFKIENIENNDGKGVKITKSYSDIDKLSTPLDNEVIISNYLNSDFNENELFTIRKSFFKNTYAANFKYRLGSLRHKYNPNGESLINLSKYQFIVNLPYEAITTNANIKSEDGKTLTWNLNPSEDSSIMYSFELYNMINIYIVGCLGLVVLSVIVIIIIKIVKYFKKIKRDALEKERILKIKEQERKDIENFAIVEENDLPPEVASESESNKRSGVSYEFTLTGNNDTNADIENQKPVIKSYLFIDNSENDKKIEEEKINNVPVNIPTLEEFNGPSAFQSNNQNLNMPFNNNQNKFIAPEPVAYEESNQMMPQNNYINNVQNMNSNMMNNNMMQMNGLPVMDQNNMQMMNPNMMNNNMMQMNELPVMDQNNMQMMNPNMMNNNMMQMNGLPVMDQNNMQMMNPNMNNIQNNQPLQNSNNMNFSNNQMFGDMMDEFKQSDVMSPFLAPPPGQAPTVNSETGVPSMFDTGAK